MIRVLLVSVLVALYITLVTKKGKKKRKLLSTFNYLIISVGIMKVQVLFCMHLQSH
jgi:hypothetical protein